MSNINPDSSDSLSSGDIDEFSPDVAAPNDDDQLVVEDDPEFLESCMVIDTEMKKLA